MEHEADLALWETCVAHHAFEPTNVVWTLSRGRGVLSTPMMHTGGVALASLAEMYRVGSWPLAPPPPHVIPELTELIAGLEVERVTLTVRSGLVAMLWAYDLVVGREQAWAADVYRQGENEYYGVRHTFDPARVPGRTWLKVVAGVEAL